MSDRAKNPRIYEAGSLWGKIEDAAKSFGVYRNTLCKWHSRGYVPEKWEERIASRMKVRVSGLKKLRVDILKGERG